MDKKQPPSNITDAARAHANVIAENLWRIDAALPLEPLSTASEPKQPKKTPREVPAPPVSPRD